MHCTCPNTTRSVGWGDWWVCIHTPHFQEASGQCEWAPFFVRVWVGVVWRASAIFCCAIRSTKHICHPLNCCSCSSSARRMGIHGDAIWRKLTRNNLTFDVTTIYKLMGWLRDLGWPHVVPKFLWADLIAWSWRDWRVHPLHGGGTDAMQPKCLMVMLSVHGLIYKSVFNYPSFK